MEVVDGATRIVVHDTHLDAGSAQALSDHLLALAGRVGAGQLEVDLESVQSMSDTCLGKLIALDRRLRIGGGRLRLLNVGPAIYEVFEVTHLTTVLDVQHAA
jgi:stage II sporulation protein AA (anti-sigma F factor antagonist)